MRALGAKGMFDLYGMKWPRSFEFVAVQRAVSELKVTIFALGVLLTLVIIILGLLHKTHFKVYAAFSFAFAIVYLLFSSWVEDYPKFACSCIIVISYTVVIVSVYLTTHALILVGFSLYTVFNIFIWLYALAVLLMAVRPLLASRT